MSRNHPLVPGHCSRILRIAVAGVGVLALAACGSSSGLATTTTATPTTTAPTGLTKAQQVAKFLAIVAPYNLVVVKWKASTTNPTTDSQLRAWVAPLVAATQTFDDALLRDGFTGQAATDARGMAVAGGAVIGDLQGFTTKTIVQGETTFVHDMGTESGYDNALRADLGLPPAETPTTAAATTTTTAAPTTTTAAPTTTTAAPTTTTVAPTFPASVQSTYLGACEVEGTKPYCQCTLAWWKTNRTVPQLNAQAQSDIDASIAACTAPVAISVLVTGTGPALVEIGNGDSVSTHNGALPYRTSITANPTAVLVNVMDLSDSNGATVNCRLTIPGYPVVTSSGNGPMSSATCMP